MWDVPAESTLGPHGASLHSSCSHNPAMLVLLEKGSPFVPLGEKGKESRWTKSTLVGDILSLGRHLLRGGTSERRWAGVMTCAGRPHACGHTHFFVAPLETLPSVSERHV